MLNSAENMQSGLEAESRERKLNHLKKMESKAVGPKVNECWLWTGWKNKQGYGDLDSTIKGTRRAHRVIYESVFGKIEDDRPLDHLCRNNSCINPFHLEVVSSYENLMRGINIASINKKKTHCHKGHPLEGTNVFLIKCPTAKGGFARQCRACRAILRKKYVTARISSGMCRTPGCNNKRRPDSVSRCAECLAETRIQQKGRDRMRIGRHK